MRCVGLTRCAQTRGTCLSGRFDEQLAEALGSNYTLQRELTGGGMSRVFVAIEHGLERSVVVKVLRPDLAEGINRERFRREVVLAAKLQHPLIVPVLHAGEHGSLLWYTMPFIEGESLRESIKRTGPSSPRDVVRALHDVLDALAFAHSRGVIHRDIKPGNILRHGNHFLVTDFGVAKALSAALPHASGMTTAGTAIGTPAYMAPEQLAGDPNADHRLDLYAVGLLAYELLTGEQAFSESSPQATMAAQLTRMPRDLSVLRPDIDTQIAALIMHLLAKSPDDRPESAAVALEELDRITTTSGTTVVMARPVPAKKSYWMPWAAVATLLLAIVALWWANSRQSASAAKMEASTEATQHQRDSVLLDSMQRVAARDQRARDSVRADSLKRAELAIAARRKTPSADSARATAVSSGSNASPGAAGRSGAARGVGGASRAQPKVTSAEATMRANRRVAVFPLRVPPNRDNLVAAGPIIQDSLRIAIQSLGYPLATDAELLQLLSQSGVAQRRLAESLHIGAFVSAELAPRGDEVVAQAQVIDVWRGLALTQRQAADLEKPLDVMTITRDVGRALDRIAWRSRTDPHVVMFYDVENATGVDSLNRLATEVSDSVRVVVGRSSASVLPLDSAMRATRDVTARQQIAIKRGAGVIITGSINRMRGDSVLVRVGMRDMSEDRLLAPIDFRTSAADWPAIVAQVVAQVAARMAQVNWGPKSQ